MTGKERLSNLLNGKPVDRLAWTTLVDDSTRSVMPREWRDRPVLDFYRGIGCDIACFGNYGLPGELQVPSPCRRACDAVTEKCETEADGRTIRRLISPWGELRAEFAHGHPTRYPVQTLDDLRTLTQVWFHSRYEEDPGDATERRHAELVTSLDDDGVYLHTLGPSPVQALLEYDMGLENFYAFWSEHPEALGELLAIMHRQRMREYEICARRVPCQAFIAVENTSTTMISPAVYEHYSLPQLQDYAAILHRHNKLFILHMCGHLRDLLPLIQQTGADGVNAVTPPTVGNTRYEDVLNVMGEDTLLWGGILDPTVFHSSAATRSEIEKALDAIYTPRLCRARFLLWVPADGLPTPVERFLAVRDWMNSRRRVG